MNSPLVFCHNDLQGGNILVRNDVDFSKSIDDSIVVIDYEFCCYNFRGFDIANHLCEWTYDYNRSDNPFYTLKEENYPSKEKQVCQTFLWMKFYCFLSWQLNLFQLDFFRIYLQQYISDDPHVSGSAVPNCSRKKSLTLEQQVQALYKEVQVRLNKTGCQLFQSILRLKGETISRYLLWLPTWCGRCGAFPTLLTRRWSLEIG